MLERIPAETFDWKPHEKSMTMGHLAGLVADMFGWFEFMIEEDELISQKATTKATRKLNGELVKIFETSRAPG